MYAAHLHKLAEDEVRQTLVRKIADGIAAKP